jgi:hypothetical protein
MKLSNLIKQLEDKLAKHGDIEVGVFTGSYLWEADMLEFMFDDDDDTKVTHIGIDKNDDKEIEMY